MKKYLLNMDENDKLALKNRFEEMTIKCWTKTIYTDDPDINDILINRDLPSGKRILRVDGEMHEIEVNAPNVDESDFCPFNVCPAGTVAVEEACLENAEIREPIEKTRKQEVIRLDEQGQPVLGDRIVGGNVVDISGKPIFESKEVKYKGCPEGWILGDRTDVVNWVGGKQPLQTAGITHKEEAGLGVDIKEKMTSEGANLEVYTTPVCVKKQPMPMEKKWVEMITDSIIGWGGYAEFPFWDVSWGVMNSIADQRSRWTGSYMTHAAEIEEGYRVCWNDYNEYPCACFKDKEDAKNFNSNRKYYESNELLKDVEEILKESGMDVTDENIDGQIRIEREFFFDDLRGQYPSYLGMGEKTFRDEPVQYTNDWESKKRFVVLVKEDL